MINHITRASVYPCSLLFISVHSNKCCKMSCGLSIYSPLSFSSSFLLSFPFLRAVWAILLAGSIVPRSFQFPMAFPPQVSFPARILQRETPVRDIFPTQFVCNFSPPEVCLERSFNIECLPV